MITGIGIDSVDIDRFKRWHTYKSQQLRKLFCQHEIDYCLLSAYKSAERFAARFAAREAFFKALASTTNKVIPFLKVCKAINVEKYENGQPILKVNWKILNISDAYRCHLSLTHTTKTATAFVIIEQQ